MGATAVVPLTSDIKRKKWMHQGLLQKASTSKWAPLMGSSKDAVVYQVNNTSATEGHTVVFDYEGNLSGKAIVGNDTAVGKGEQKKLFSDKLTVEVYRNVVNNGRAFDGVDVGNLSITQHGDSRNKLGDLFIRVKDQSLYDASQGLLGQAPTHIIDLGTTFTVNDLHDIETTVKTGRGFATGGTRRPPEPYIMPDGKPMWLLKVDAPMAAKLKKDGSFQSLAYQGDVRGNQNRAFSGIIGKIGNLWIQEDDMFFGATPAGTSWGLGDSEIEIAGMRQYDTVNSAWTGQAGFDPASTLKSRGVLLGAGALQLAMGKQPDYKFEDWDFGAKSESAIEYWMETKKCIKKTENNDDYKEAKVADLDWGVIAVEVQI